MNVIEYVLIVFKEFFLFYIYFVDNMLILFIVLEVKVLNWMRLNVVVMKGFFM